VDVAIMLVCGVMLLLGLAAGVWWSGRPFSTPDPQVDLTPAEVARRFVWYVSIVLIAGPFAGLAVIGGGGRLAMRLLAVTSGDDAQGRITEADQVVGQITLDGTIDFVLFNGIIGGLLGGALFLLVRRVIPSGRWGGVVFGLGLLVIFGATIEPLRKDNPDFDIVGPGWVSVLVFTLMAVAFGLAVQGLTNRVSAWLPLPSTERRVLLRYALPLALAVLLFSVTAFLVVIGVVAVLLTRWPPIVDAVRSRRWIVAGRVFGLSLVALSLPYALSSVIDIATR